MGHSRHPLTGPERFFWGSHPSTDGGVVRRTVAYLDFVEARSGEEDSRTVQQSLERIATRLDVADGAQDKNSVPIEPSDNPVFVPAQAHLVDNVAKLLKTVQAASPTLRAIETDVLYQQLAVLADTIDAHTAQDDGMPTTSGGRLPRDPTNPEGGWGLYLDAFTGRKRILLTLAAVTYSVVSWVSALR